MLWSIIYLLLSCFFSPCFAWAQSSSQQTTEKNWGGRDEMNGIRLRDYPDFEKKWQLVTVRFRKDTSELRFTYANEKAWTALQNKSKDYPEGAVFAKIGFITQEDNYFPSSAVPTGAKRYQLMVRDKKRFKETDGWGYALFQGTGVTYNEDAKTSAIACHACHRIVEGLGFVFSQPVQLNPFASHLQILSNSISGGILAFRDGTQQDLPIEAQQRLPADVKKIRLLTGALQKNMFEGTLNEVRPALAAEALKTGAPSALISDNKKMFAVVFIDGSNSKCRERESATDMRGFFTAAQPDEKNPLALKSPRPLIDLHFCWK